MYQIDLHYLDDLVRMGTILTVCENEVVSCHLHTLSCPSLSNIYYLERSGASLFVPVSALGTEKTNEIFNAIDEIL